MQSSTLSVGFKAKRAVVSTSLLALGVAFEIVSKHAKELKEELKYWQDGLVISLGVLNGPIITFKNDGGEIKYLGKGIKGNPDLTIYFKNVDSAFMTFTGQMGSYTAFVQHRALLHGNVGQAMQASRAMAIVQTYLMPGLIFDKLFKRAPKLSASQLALKARVMATLTPLMIAKAGK